MVLPANLSEKQARSGVFKSFSSVWYASFIALVCERYRTMPRKPAPVTDASTLQLIASMNGTISKYTAHIATLERDNQILREQNEMLNTQNVSLQANLYQTSALLNSATKDVCDLRCINSILVGKIQELEGVIHSIRQHQGVMLDPVIADAEPDSKSSVHVDVKECDIAQDVQPIAEVQTSIENVGQTVLVQQESIAVQQEDLEPTAESVTYVTPSDEEKKAKRELKKQKVQAAKGRKHAQAQAEAEKREKELQDAKERHRLEQQAQNAKKMAEKEEKARREALEEQEKARQAQEEKLRQEKKLAERARRAECQAVREAKRQANEDAEAEARAVRDAAKAAKDKEIREKNAAAKKELEQKKQMEANQRLAQETVRRMRIMQEQYPQHKQEAQSIIDSIIAAKKVEVEKRAEEYAKKNPEIVRKLSEAALETGNRVNISKSEGAKVGVVSVLENLPECDDAPVDEDSRLFLLACSEVVSKSDPSAVYAKSDTFDPSDFVFYLSMEIMSLVGRAFSIRNWDDDQKFFLFCNLEELQGSRVISKEVDLDQISSWFETDALKDACFRFSPKLKDEMLTYQESHYDCVREDIVRRFASAQKQEPELFKTLQLQQCDPEVKDVWGLPKYTITVEGQDGSPVVISQITGLVWHMKGKLAYLASRK